LRHELRRQVGVFDDTGLAPDLYALAHRVID
jgi:hypothetical protein